MTAIFEKLLEMSLTSAVVIVVVILIRLCLRKAPRKYAYALWSVAAFRLVCPVSFRSVFSLFTFTNRLEETQIQSSVTDPLPATSPGYFASAVPGSAPSIDIDPEYVFTYPVTTPQYSADPIQIALFIAGVVWLVGLAALLIYAVVSCLRLRRRMSTAVLLEDNIWQSDRVQSPFILGFVRPQIYLPFGLTDDQRRYVLAHERYHLKRFDHIVRPLSFLILAVHWFNPFVWLAYYLMARDMEMSCDEKVLSGGENVKDYSTTLLSFAANRRFPSPSPLAFGESGVKGRIKNALNWKKPRTWVTVIAIVVCVVVIIVCAANPKEPDTSPAIYDVTSVVTAAELGSAALSAEDKVTVHLNEEEKDQLAGLLNQLSAEDFEGTYLYSEVSPNSELNITFPWGSLYRTDGQLYLGMIDSEGGSVNDYPFWRVASDGLAQFIDDLAAIYGYEGDPTVLDKLWSVIGDYQPYESVDCLYCLYMNPLSSVSPGNGDSGQRWFISTDRVTIYNKNEDTPAADFAPAPDWQVLTAEKWESMFQFSGNIPDISGYNTVLLRTLSEEYALVYADGELWAMETRGGYIWAVWRMAATVPSTEPEESEPVTLAVWQADLTHDGVDEIITLTREDSDPISYTMTVTTYGKTLWDTKIIAGFDQEGWHLYEKDGKSYLMQWAPVNAQGYYNYNYQIFSLTQEGGTVTLAENSLQFDLNTPYAILDLDIEAIRAFGDEVNALLADTQVLVTSSWEGAILGDPANPAPQLWDCPADDFEQTQQYYQDRASQREANTLAVWPLNDLTVTVLETDREGVYLLDVYRDDYFFWESGEIRTYAAGLETYYFIYREDGVEYLAEFTGLRDQGWGLYSYKVFSMEPETLDILYQNALYYNSASEENVLTVDIEAIVAFENEVNALFKDADLICGTENGQFFWNAGGTDSDMMFHWRNPDLDRIQQAQQLLLSAQAQREASTLAVWPLNDLTVTVLKTEDENVYTLDVYGNDYFLWSTELHTFPQTGNTYYMVYRENGTEYLAEFTGTTRQAVGLYSYRVFSVGPESLDILYENSIQYEFMSAETSLCVDLEAIEAFQNEVNTLFKDADLICAVENGEFAYAPGGTDSAFRWVNPDLETLTKRKQGYLSEMPLVVNNLATDKGIEFLWAINDQIKLRLGENGVARVTKGEEIPTGAVGTTSGDFLWQITYLPGQYHADSCSITWQGKEVIYVITHEDWSGGTREWWFVAALDEEELQSRFATEEMLAQYGDPYLAAVVEIVKLWRAEGGNT